MFFNLPIVIGIGTPTPEVALDVNTGVINASEICDENNANCIDSSAGVGGADNLGNHSATQNIDLNAFNLVGNNGSSGLEIDATGKLALELLLILSTILKFTDMTPTVVSLQSMDDQQLHATQKLLLKIMMSRGLGDTPMFYGVNSRGNDGSPLPIQAGDVLSSFLGQDLRIRVIHIKQQLE